MSDSIGTPEGRGTGAAVTFGDSTGLGALRYLQNTDAIAAKLAQRKAEAAAREKAAQDKAFAAALQGVNTDTGLVYEPQARENIKKFFADSQVIMRDTSRPVGDRLAQISENRALLENGNKTGIRAEEHVKSLFTKFSADPRYDQNALIENLRQSMYDPEGNVKPVDQYNPRAVEASVNTPKIYNAGEVYKAFNKSIAQKDSEAFEKAARPGGTGLKIYYETNQMVERDPKTHLPVLDPATGEPVLRITPATMLAARNDPFVSKHLDYLQTQRQQLEQSAVQKMQNNEPLTEVERAHVEQRQQGALPTAQQDLAAQLVPYAYSRTRHEETFKPLPRPPAAAKGAGSKNQVTVDNEALPGTVIGARGSNGASGIVSLGTLPAATYGKPGEEVKKYRAKGVKHQELVTQRNDGSPAEAERSNQAIGDFEYGARHILLRSTKTGRVQFPSNNGLEAAQRGDFSISDADARRFRAEHPEYKPEYYIEAAPLGKAGTQIGSQEEYFHQLKTEEDAFRKAYASGPTTELAKSMAEAGIPMSEGKPPRFRSDMDLRDMAQKKYADVNKTHYVRYSGNDKLLIDGATHYAYRRPESKLAMEKALSAAEERTSPTAADRAKLPSPTLGRGPLAGQLPAAPPPAATSGKTPTPAANKYGFKFKPK